MNSPSIHRRSERYVRGRAGWLALVVAQFVVVNLVNFKVLEANLSAGIYPTDGDSIGIPLMSSMLMGAVVAALCSAAVLAPVALRIVRIGLIGLAGAVTLLQTLVWADLDHWPMAVSYAICTIILIGIVLRIFRDSRLSRQSKP